jgi:hypothetical protein
MSLTIKAQLASAMLTNINSWMPQFDDVSIAERYVGVEEGSSYTTEKLVELSQKVTTKVLMGYVDSIYEAMLQSEK